VPSTTHDKRRSCRSAAAASAASCGTQDRDHAMRCRLRDVEHRRSRTSGSSAAPCTRSARAGEASSSMAGHAVVRPACRGSTRGARS
jgi:hypothetical protein